MDSDSISGDDALATSSSRTFPKRDFIKNGIGIRSRKKSDSSDDGSSVVTTDTAVSVTKEVLEILPMQSNMTLSPNISTSSKKMNITKPSGTEVRRSAPSPRDRNPSDKISSSIPFTPTRHGALTPTRMTQIADVARRSSGSSDNKIAKTESSSLKDSYDSLKGSSSSKGIPSSPATENNTPDRTASLKSSKIGSSSSLMNVFENIPSPSIDSRRTTVTDSETLSVISHGTSKDVEITEVIGHQAVETTVQKNSDANMSDNISNNTELDSSTNTTVSPVKGDIIVIPYTQEDRERKRQMELEARSPSQSRSSLSFKAEIAKDKQKSRSSTPGKLDSSENIDTIENLSPKDVLVYKFTATERDDVGDNQSNKSEIESQKMLSNKERRMFSVSTDDFIPDLPIQESPISSSKSSSNSPMNSQKGDLVVIPVTVDVKERTKPMNIDIRSKSRERALSGSENTPKPERSKSNPKDVKPIKPTSAPADNKSTRKSLDPKTLAKGAQPAIKSTPAKPSPKTELANVKLSPKSIDTSKGHLPIKKVLESPKTAARPSTSKNIVEKSTNSVPVQKEGVAAVQTPVPSPTKSQLATESNDSTTTPELFKSKNSIKVTESDDKDKIALSPNSPKRGLESSASVRSVVTTKSGKLGYVSSTYKGLPKSKPITDVSINYDTIYSDVATAKAIEGTQRVIETDTAIVNEIEIVEKSDISVTDGSFSFSNPPSVAETSKSITEAKGSVTSKTKGAKPGTKGSSHSTNKAIKPQMLLPPKSPRERALEAKMKAEQALKELKEAQANASKSTKLTKIVPRDKSPQPSDSANVTLNKKIETKTVAVGILKSETGTIHSPYLFIYGLSRHVTFTFITQMLAI